MTGTLGFPSGFSLPLCRFAVDEKYQKNKWAVGYSEDVEWMVHPPPSDLFSLLPSELMKDLISGATSSVQ